MSQRINPFNLFVGSFIPNWLLKRPDVSASAKLVYGRLCQYSGHDGRCFPKQETVAAEIGVTLDTVNRCVRQLVDLGLIEMVKTGQGRSSEYFFLAHEWMELQSCFRKKPSLIPEKPESDSGKSQIKPAIELALGEENQGKRVTEEKSRRAEARRGLSDRWMAAFRDRFGQKYPFAGVKDVKACDKLLQKPLQELLDLATWCWDLRDGSWERSMALSLASFASYYERLLACKIGDKAPKRALNVSDHEKGW